MAEPRRNGNRVSADAAALGRAIAEVLGSAARSVILHGSLAAGGFRPGRSDVDLLVIVDGGVTDAQAAALEGLDPGDATGVDLHVVTTEVAGAPSRAPALELYLGHGERERHVAAAPDLLAELSMARADGIALLGAQPREVIAPVPAEWVVDRGRHWLRTWRSLTRDTGHAAFMVLTACRIWLFAVENVHASKIRAARWALTRAPSLVAVAEAIRQYEDEPSTVVHEPGIAAVLDTVLRETSSR